MKIIGLTGGIATGKSNASKMLRRQGIPVHDADATVHRLLGKGGAAVGVVGKIFPQALRQSHNHTEHYIDRSILGSLVFGHPTLLKTLESLLHPLIRQEEKRFLQRHQRYGTPLVVLDIPLLLETNGQKRCDAIMITSCPIFLQKQRAMKRKGMTEEKFSAILAHQATALQRRKHATWLIPSGGRKSVTWRKLQTILASLA